MKKGVLFILVFLILISLSFVNAQSDLVLYLKFDENTGTVVDDSSGMNNNGQIEGATWVPAGKVGSALHFDGVDDYVTVPHSSSLNFGSFFTWGIWIKPPTTITSSRVIIRKGEGKVVLLGTGGALKFTIDGVDCSVAAGFLTAGTWNHIAVTYDNSNKKIYVNGVLRNTCSQTYNLQNTLSVNIGTLYVPNPVNPVNVFVGNIDEVKMYNRPLTEAEIQEIYDAYTCSDDDNDLYKINGGTCGLVDCDDTNPNIYPANTNTYCDCETATNPDQGSTEICDNIDNDCDSVTDGITQECGTDIGECAKGTQTCSAGLWGACDDYYIAPSTEICDDILDNNCDGNIDCLDSDCSSASNCINCDLITDEMICRSNNLCWWYFDPATGSQSCESCTPLPTCSLFGTMDDCTHPLGSQYSCGKLCIWGGTTCGDPSCPLGDSDGDGICDVVDNCKYIANPNQENCDSGEDIIGDACDAACTMGDETSCESDTCEQCIDTDIPTDGICDELPDSPTQNCADIPGIICGSGQECIGNYPLITTKDSSKCCVGGNCGTIEILLSGAQSITRDVTDCGDPNEEGIGTKTVVKTVNGVDELPYQVECTILPTKTVPFYSLISLIVTILVLVIFYLRKRL
ncbi:hypothetical protein J4427_03380 [Candidatus Woesearchaeota archaeon]|nr:hypothetical protein [Candidatus Woesearchaeota archaeon]